MIYTVTINQHNTEIKLNGHPLRVTVRVGRIKSVICSLNNGTAAVYSAVELHATGSAQTFDVEFKY